MNSVGVLIRMLSVVSDSGSPLPGARSGDAHIAVQLHIVAVGAHLSAVGREMPDFAAHVPAAAPRPALRLRAGVVVHLADVSRSMSPDSVCWRMTLALRR